METFRLGRIWSQDFPGRSHFPHRAEIGWLVGEPELRSFQWLARFLRGLHRCCECAGDQHRAFDRIGCFPMDEVMLNGMGERLEEVAVLPGPHIERGGVDFRFSIHPTGEIPTCTIVSQTQNCGFEAIPVGDQ